MCPVSFTQEEAEQINALNNLYQEANGDTEQFNQVVGVGSMGWTPNKRSESAKSRADKIQKTVLASVDEPWLRGKLDRHWPLDDYDEDE